MRISKPKRSAKVRKPIKRGKRPNRQRRTSRGAQGRLADKLFSMIVRAKGECAWHVVRGQRWAECAGVMQCAHVCGRTYRSTRWDEDNAVPLCAGAHVFMTHHPLEWDEFITGRMGAEDFAALKRRALAKWDGDLEGVLVRLAARAVSLNLEPK